MKKLLTLTALIAGVALFAECMNKPVEEDVVVEDVVIEEVVEDVVVEEAIIEDVIADEVMPEATAE